MLALWLLVVFMAVPGFARPPSHSWEFAHTIHGEEMSTITACPEFNMNDLHPGNIHIVVSLTANMQEYYQSYTETVRYYASMHGYHFRLVDPSAMLTKFGGDFKPFFSSIDRKSVV